jgi:hypothetical protein
LAYPYADFDTMEFRRFDVVRRPNARASLTGRSSYGDARVSKPELAIDQRGRAVPATYFLSEKWNGMNVLVFKYEDAGGCTRLSAKSKGAPFLTDGGYGKFLSLTRKALGLSSDTPITLDAIRESVQSGKDALGRGLSMLAPMLDEQVQSMTFELCGSQEPHLVRYDFALRMVPLFLTHRNGVIRPVRGLGYGREEGPFPFDQKEMVDRCRRYQADMLARNEDYRREAGLRHRVGALSISL